MEDNKNMELNDEILENAAGGKFETLEPIEPYEVGCRVLCKGNEGELTGTIKEVHAHDKYMVSYIVEFDNGKTYTVPHFALRTI